VKVNPRSTGERDVKDDGVLNELRRVSEMQNDLQKRSPPGWLNVFEEMMIQRIICI
jgi:hypothetical protein